jgi:hypothetical protein
MSCKHIWGSGRISWSACRWHYHLQDPYIFFPFPCTTEAHYTWCCINYSCSSCILVWAYGNRLSQLIFFSSNCFFFTIVYNESSFPSHTPSMSKFLKYGQPLILSQAQLLKDNCFANRLMQFTPRASKDIKVSHFRLCTLDLALLCKHFSQLDM